MQPFTSLLLLRVLALQACVSATAKMYYVNSGSNGSCPDQPCLTMDQYVEHASDEYFTSGSTFMFLPGNHSLQSSIILSHISNITLRGMENSSATVIITTPQNALRFKNVSDLNLQWLAFDLSGYQQHIQGYALEMNDSISITITDCVFTGIGDLNRTMGALKARESNITITRSQFERNTGKGGGAVRLVKSYIVLSNNSFIKNRALYGGAIYTIKSTIILSGWNQFLHNVAESFKECKQAGVYAPNGGALLIAKSILTLSGAVNFSNNRAICEGGAIQLIISSTFGSLGGKSLVFSHNSAGVGGGMSIDQTSDLKVNDLLVQFVGNSAASFGGGLNIRKPITEKRDDVEISASFSHNVAEHGGAVSVNGPSTIYLLRTLIKFFNTNMIYNSGSALHVSDSNVVFIGHTEISHNTGGNGGGINSRYSSVTFTSYTVVTNNSALSSGGAIHSIYGNITFDDSTHFKDNRADLDGGAIYAESTDIVVKCIIIGNCGSLKLYSNSAKNGGAMYLNAVTMTIEDTNPLHIIDNSATEHGGAIYYVDTPTPAQCSFTRHKADIDTFQRLPKCFLQVENPIAWRDFYSLYNSAGKGGLLYGGFLDKCRPAKPVYTDIVSTLDLLKSTTEEPQNITASEIASEIYELWFCNSSQDHSYARSISMEVLRGQSFSVCLLALVQGGFASSTSVTAIIPNSRPKALQIIQLLEKGCSSLTYNLFSAESQDQLILFPDGPCRDTRLARLVINVTFLRCPEGFTV